MILGPTNFFMIYHLDIETYSPEDLAKTGSFKYAEHPKARMLCFAIAKEDEDPITWDELNGGQEALDLLKEAVDTDSIIVAHNAMFESSCFNFMNLPEGFTIPKLENWRCSYIQALRCGLPGGLARLAIRLKLNQKKDDDGKRLIKMFCIGETPTLPKENPKEFQKLVEYCRQDVRTEQAIWDRISSKNVSDFEQQVEIVDRVINHRGYRVRVDAVAPFMAFVDSCKTAYNKRFTDITGIEASRRGKCLEWFSANGYGLKNLTADSRKLFLNKYKSRSGTKLYKAMEIYDSLSYTAQTKIEAIKRCASKDGRVRGTLQHYGGHTGRWSGKNVQPQNFKRVSIANAKELFDAICNGLTVEEAESLYDESPLMLVSNVVRLFISGPIGDVDYASIEARIISWLAQQEDSLESYRTGADLYVKMGSVVSGKPESECGKGTLERFLGKQVILGCGYGMGAPRFKASCENRGFNISDDLAKRSVKAYRNSHPKIVQLWDKLNDAVCRMASGYKGGGVNINNLMEVSRSALFNAVTIELPSGRKVYYQSAKYENGDCKYFDRNNAWSVLYGGKIAENVTQAVAADVMAEGLINAEKLNFVPINTIHDQCHCENVDDIDGFINALTALPDWAKGLPVKAEGEVVEAYGL